MKNRSSFADAFASHGDTIGMKRYMLMSGYMNQKCPAVVGKFRSMRERSFIDVALSICPQSIGRVLYITMKMKNGGKICRNLFL